jgi:hypothetical protein
MRAEVVVAQPQEICAVRRYGRMGPMADQSSDDDVQQAQAGSASISFSGQVRQMAVNANFRSWRLAREFRSGAVFLLSDPKPDIHRPVDE